MIFFNVCVYNISIRVIFIIVITKNNYIGYILIKIKIVINHIISNIKRYEFIFLYIKQVMINFDIFKQKIISYQPI